MKEREQEDMRNEENISRLEEEEKKEEHSITSINKGIDKALSQTY
jgi:hypothetical protein